MVVNVVNVVNVANGQVNGEVKVKAKAKVEVGEYRPCSVSSHLLEAVLPTSHVDPPLSCPASHSLTSHRKSLTQRPHSPGDSCMMT